VTREQVFEKVTQKMAELFDLDPAAIKPQSRFEDLELTSLDAIDLVIELQQMTGRKVSETGLRSVRTVEDPHAPRAGEQAPALHLIAVKVLLVSANQTGFPYPVYPLGLDHVAGAISPPHEVRILDLCPVPEDGVAEAIAGEIREFAPDAVGLSIRNIDNNDATAAEALLAPARGAVPLDLAIRASVA